MISVTCAMPAAYVRRVVSMRTYSEGMVLTPRHPKHFAPIFLTQPAHPSAVEANEAIRALVDAQAGQDWTPMEAAEYEVLLIEWAAATQGIGSGIAEAA
jgi:hypothetical protein